jgi:hypothetical protein
MPELPRLYDLIRLANSRGYHTNGVFQGYARNITIKQAAHKSQRIFLFTPALCEPAGATDSQKSTGRVGNQHIPLPGEPFLAISQKMKILPFAFRFEQITRPCIMPALSKGIAHNARKLASNQDFHKLTRKQTGFSFTIP